MHSGKYLVSLFYSWHKYYWCYQIIHFPGNIAISILDFSLLLIVKLLLLNLANGGTNNIFCPLYIAYLYNYPF